MIKPGRATAFVTALSLLLSACVTPGTSGGRSSAIGPQLSSLFGADKEEPPQNDENRPRLDIVIPVFDPGIEPEDEENYEQVRRDGWQDKNNYPVTADEYVWPELRRAEAIRFAHQLKLALEETGAFGAVRVTPDATATGDLYLLGRIAKSDGQEVEFKLEAVDISGNRWFSQYFEHEVEEGFYDNLRNEGKDPYEPAFDAAAEYLVEELDYYETSELVTIRRVTELRFASHFADEAFADHLLADDGRFMLASFPSENDPMLQRTRAIRVRDQLFVDGLQKNYEQFAADMERSYRIWQEQSAFEIAAKRDAQLEAIGEGILGVLAIGLAVAAVAAGSRSDNAGSATAATTAGVAAGVIGATLLSRSFQTSKEAEVHREALEELGKSIDLELAPQVIEFEEKTVELQGTASEQFAQWRKFLQEIYAQESVPDVQL